MPTIKRQDVYDLFYRAACEIFDGDLKAYRTTLDSKDVLYRYVGYRDAMPQEENAGRTVFLRLANDTENRWTGSDLNGGGHQGLYLSAEFVSENHPFPELEHYQKRDEYQHDSQVTCFNYTPDNPPELVSKSVSELRSMFLFTLGEEVHGIDLRYPGDHVPHCLLQQIFAKACEQDTRGLIANAKLGLLHNDPEDAAFCRAVGNACFEKTAAQFFQTTSVRSIKDPRATNIIMRAPKRLPNADAQPITTLIPQGRATFFVGDCVGQGVFTVSDMLYNRAFEDAGLAAGASAPVQEFVETLYSAAKNSIVKVTNEVHGAKTERPRSQVIATAFTKIADMRAQIEGRTLTHDFAYRTLSVLLAIPDAGLSRLEQWALRITLSAMKDILEYAKAIDAATNE
ncbi:hypothetical protein SAMN05216359_12238 [Roseateles sp. YR242]|uniref:hypothetical protein n=1 Tax=Roseateles sp. YR242 TaxID=1855305 RepID=UPI0008BE824B|nr:hypothetical protein [Roseateles sp. YR242]SEL89624.1 hypothetical protein SAMN05216359_12238 [Roseateles sp. YR242]